MNESYVNALPSESCMSINQRLGSWNLKGCEMVEPRRHGDPKRRNSYTTVLSRNPLIASAISCRHHRSKSLRPYTGPGKAVRTIVHTDPDAHTKYDRASGNVRMTV